MELIIISAIIIAIFMFKKLRKRIKGMTNSFPKLRITSNSFKITVELPPIIERVEKKIKQLTEARGNQEFIYRMMTFKFGDFISKQCPNPHSLRWQAPKLYASIISFIDNKLQRLNTIKTALQNIVDKDGPKGELESSQLVYIFNTLNYSI